MSGWYRKTSFNRNTNYIFFLYRNSALFPMIREIYIQYTKATQGFFVHIKTAKESSQESIKASYKTIFTETEFKEHFYHYEGIHHYKEFTTNSTMQLKIIQVFEHIHKTYPNEIATEVMQDIRNIFAHNFETKFVSSIPLWQDIPTYINPQHLYSQKLVLLTNEFLVYPKHINPMLYLRLLKEGENPNQKDKVYGKTILFMLTQNYHCFNHQGVENLVYKLILILIFYGADIFHAENGLECISPVEVMDNQGYPGVFRNIIMANSRIEKPLKVKSVDQKLIDDVITTEFKFEDNKKDPIVTKLLTVEQFSKDQNAVNKCYELFNQTFEDPKGSASKVKKEFDRAFTSNKNERILIEIIYAIINGTNQIIGFTVYNIYKDTQDVVLNIDYSLVDKKYRFGLMTFLDFRIGFCLAILNPHLQSAIYFGSLHANSFEMIDKEILYPKYNIQGAERVIQKMMGDNSNIKTVHHEITRIREEPLQVKGPHFTKPPENVQQRIFYQFIMGFAEDPAAPNHLIPPTTPISAFIYAPITREFFTRMKEYDFDSERSILQLSELLLNLDKSLAQTKNISFNPEVFPKAISLFAPPIEHTPKNFQEKPRFKSKL